MLSADGEKHWPLPRRGPPSVQTPLRPHHRLQLQSTLVPTRRQRAVSAAVVAPPSNRCARTGHCSSSHCSGRRRPSKATNRAGTAEQPPLPTYVPSSLPLQVTALCTHAPMRRWMHGAVPLTALWGRLRCADLSVPRPSRSGRGRCLCAAHPGHACACTPPHRVHIVWHIALDRLDRCIDPAAVCSPPSGVR